MLIGSGQRLAKLAFEPSAFIGGDPIKRGQRYQNTWSVYR